VPVPKSTLASLENYKEYREEVRALGRAKSTDLIDFNDLVALKDDTHFLDFQHLNRDGVAALSPVVFHELTVRGLISPAKTAAR
jgi:hypothetical protein